MYNIHCPKDIGFENTFNGEDCKAEQFYNDCHHCWESAITKRCHQERQQDVEIVEELKWESEDICDNCGYEIPHLEKVIGDVILMDSKNWKYCPNCGERRELDTE